MDYLYTLLKFIIAGCMIVGVTLIVHHIDPKYGGILAAAPIITTISFVATYFETSHGITRELVLGSIYFAVPSLLFLLTLYLLMNRMAFLPSLSGAYLVWIGGVVILHHMISGSYL